MYKKGDRVELLSTPNMWTSNYAGQTVTIVHKEPMFTGYTVVADDGHKFYCPSVYISNKTSCNSNGISVGCECGAWKVYGKDCPSFYHMFYCKLYSPPKEKK